MYHNETPVNVNNSLSDDTATSDTYEQRPVTSAGITLCRLLLTLFNGILLLFGTILVIVGISAHNGLNNYVELVGDDNINKAALTMIIAGVVCSITSVLSYFGAKHQSKLMLYATSSVLCVVFIAVVVAASSAVAYHSKINDIFRQGMTKTVEKANWIGNQDNEYMTTISALQTSLDCCGIDTYEDWSKINKNFPLGNVPVSCCKTDVCGTIHDGKVELVKNIPENDRILVKEESYNTTLIYSEGCYNKITNFVSSNTTAVLICSYGLAVFQLVGIIFSCCLCKAINGVSYSRI